MINSLCEFSFTKNVFFFELEGVEFSLVHFNSLLLEQRAFLGAQVLYNGLINRNHGNI